MTYAGPAPGTSGYSTFSQQVPQPVAAGMFGFDATQIGNAQIILDVAMNRKLGDHAGAIGIMTAITESTLNNVAYGDAMGPASRGLFQQMGPWGPLAVRMDPAGAAALFYDTMIFQSDWATNTPWVVAQKVQQSQFSDGSNYQPNWSTALFIVAALLPFVGSGAAGYTTNADGTLNTSPPTYSAPSPDGGAGSGIASGHFAATPSALSASAAALAALPKLTDLPSVTVLHFTGAATVSPLNRLGSVRLWGAALHSDVAASAVTASMSYSSTQVGELTVVLQDTADASLMRSGLIKAAVPMDYGDQHTTIRGIGVAEGKGGPQLTVKGRSRVVGRLKDQKGPGNWGLVQPHVWVADRAREAGASVICQAGFAAVTITRQASTQIESTWDVLMKLATSVGAIAFEYDQVIVFGKPSWLASRPYHTQWHISWTSNSVYSSNLDGLPLWTYSADSSDTLAFHLVGDYSQNMRPGDIVSLYGSLADANGPWFVTGVDIPYVLGQPVAVTAARIVDPVATNAMTASGLSGGSAGAVVGGDAQGNAAAALALTKVGGPYVWAANGPTSFDCSGLTVFCWAAQGITIARTSAEQANLPVIPMANLQPGDLVTYYVPTSHVAIYVGGGNVVSAADEALGIILVPATQGGPSPVAHRVPRGANSGIGGP